jgi:hypothetical protein
MSWHWLRNEADKDATAIWGFRVVESLLQAFGDALLPITHLQLEMAEAALQDGVGSVIEGVRGGTPLTPSNKLGTHLSNWQSFCRTERGNMMVPIPTMLQLYNTCIGDINLPELCISMLMEGVRCW